MSNTIEADKAAVLAAWPDINVYYNKIMRRWVWWRDSDTSAVSDHYDTEDGAWANAAASLKQEPR